jgi:hypothetical protein
MDDQLGNRQCWQWVMASAMTHSIGHESNTQVFSELDDDEIEKCE